MPETKTIFRCSSVVAYRNDAGTLCVDCSDEEHEAVPGMMAAEIERLQKRHVVYERERSLSLANNLCPDHRDKQKGKPCLACTIERLQKEIEGAKWLIDDRSWKAERAEGWNKQLEAENAALRELVTDIRDNWDCDADGHRYGTGCRACKAAELLKERQVQSDH